MSQWSGGAGTRRCPACGRRLESDEGNCECRETNWWEDRSPGKSRVLAGLLSLLFLGAGHVYLERPARGLAFVGGALGVAVVAALVAPWLAGHPLALLFVLFPIGAGADAYRLAAEGAE